jgi:hypothetical protein
LARSQQHRSLLVQLDSLSGQFTEICLVAYNCTAQPHLVTAVRMRPVHTSRSQLFRPHENACK